MKLLVISDSHANYPALEAVLADAEKQGPYDKKLCPGDIVGYGPFPNEVIERLRDEGFLSVLGNHDIHLLYEVDRRSKKPDQPESLNSSQPRHMNPTARKAILKNRELISEENIAYLRTLNEEPYTDSRGRFAMVHGSFDPGEDHEDDEGYAFKYLFEEKDVLEAMLWLKYQRILRNGCMRTEHIPLGIVGHTHQPLIAYKWINENDVYKTLRLNADDFPEEFRDKIHERKDESTTTYRHIVINADERIKREKIDESIWKPKVIINPGSVGQSRNGHPEAHYGIITIHGPRRFEIELLRVPYDIEKTQEQMRAVGMPEKLITRLEYGI